VTSSGHASDVSQFTSAETVTNTAGVEFGAGLNALHGLPTVAAMTPIVGIYAAALQKYSVELAKISWPASVRATSTGLQVQVSGFTTFLSTLGAVPPGALGTWITQFQIHALAVSSSTGRLRDRLGLSS
jgi:hypothetical protein